MTDFTQRLDEPPARWLERLLRTGIETDLTDDQRQDLARYIGAAQRVVGVQPTPHRPAPEALADSLIEVGPMTTGGPYFIRLKGSEPVLLGPYDNPNLAFKDAEKIRSFLAEVLAAREG